eukprot:gene1141-1246_t
MDFVALLSGGKDSCYNIYQCQQYGHRLVCVANLHPPQENDELNSFMYQSAGSAAIPALADCLGVPLVRRSIQGKAKNVGLQYEVTTAEDEVEDLFQLLVDVKAAFPSVRGVSCGAIISNYQRYRVENVCQRLGLTVLAYLWQRDRPQLIREIVSNGFDVVLVKVAGAGLIPEKHLGKHIADLLPALQRLHEKFGLDMCGEGGEYESLVVDAPIFQKRLILEETECVLDDEDPTVGNLNIHKCSTIVKEVYTESGSSGNSGSGSSGVGNNLIAQMHQLASSITISSPLRQSINSNCSVFSPCVRDNSGFGQSALVLPKSDYFTVTSSDPETLKAAMEKQFAEIMHFLGLSIGCKVEDVVFCHLYLSTMDHFSLANSIYCSYFPDKHPPSRSCIQMSLPMGKLVAVDACVLQDSYAVIEKSRNIRDVLHVRSLSAWAPQCIGPYSQANILYDCLIFVAGQIPLVPATMQLLSTVSSTSDGDGIEKLSADLLLCLKNVNSILDALVSSCKHLMTCVVYVNGKGLTTEALAVRIQSIRSIFDEAIVALIRERREESTPRVEGEDDYDYDEESEAEEVSEELLVKPSLVITAVNDLPRGAAVEVEVIAVKDCHVYPHLSWATRSGELDCISTSSSSSQPSNGISQLPLQRWPIWSRGNPSSPITYDWKVNWESKRLSGCLVGAALSVSTRSEDSFPIDAPVQALVDGIQEVFLECELPLISWRSLRVYFIAQDGWDSSSLEMAIGLMLAARYSGDGCHPAIICLPVLSLSSVDKDQYCFLQAQVVALDFEQIETERWIAQT